MSFIDDDRVIVVQKGSALRFRQQDSVGHQLDVSLLRRRIRKTNFVSHLSPDLHRQFFGDTSRDGTGSNSARLSMSNQTRDTSPQFQADFRQLSRFARTRLAADNDHLMITYRGSDLVFAEHHGQRVVKR